MEFVTTNAGLVSRLAEAFLQCPVGGLIKYPTLARAAGVQSIQHRRYLLSSALRIANEQSGAIFRNIRGEGYRRMHAEEAHAVGKDARRKIRRTASRAVKSITNVISKANDISDAARLKAYSEQAALGLVQHMTYDRNMPAIPEGAKPPPTVDTVRETMRALREHRSLQVRSEGTP